MRFARSLTEHLPRPDYLPGTELGVRTQKRKRHKKDRNEHAEKHLTETRVLPDHLEDAGGTRFENHSPGIATDEKLMLIRN